MSNMEPVPSVVKAKAEFDTARKKYDKTLLAAQKRCKHKHGTRTAKSNSDNYDPYDNYYWYELRCPKCLLRIDMEQSEYHDKVRAGEMVAWETWYAMVCKERR